MENFEVNSFWGYENVSSGNYANIVLNKSFDELAEIIKNPMDNNEELRNLSKEIYSSSGIFSNVIDYMTSILTLDRIVISKSKRNKERTENILRKIKDKEFSKMYGDVTTFSYGCEQSGGYDWEECCDCSDGAIVKIAPCCEVYVYRMTMVNGDGDVVEYSPAQIKYRCEQMGVNTVKEFETFIIPDDVDPGEYVVRKVEQYYDGPDPIGYTHIREGVVARILNRNNFSVYKHKNFSFKCLEGIVKDEAQAPDMEEAQEVMEDNT